MSPVLWSKSLSLSLNVGSLCLDSLALDHVEAAVVDRTATGAWPLILDEQHFSAGFSRKLVLVVRVGIEHHGSRSVERAADPKFAGQYVPDLRKLVMVQRMMPACFVANDACVRFGRPLRTRVKQHLSGLSGPPDRFPFALVPVHIFG